MTRREWLAGSAAGMTLRHLSTNQTRARRDFICSDICALGQVIVHEPGPEIYKAIAVLAPGHPFEAIDLLGQDVVTQHRQFVERISAGGAKVLRFLDLLETAIAAA